MATIADSIRAERARMGWSQDELAAALDISRPLLSDWENDKAVPDWNDIIKLSMTFRRAASAWLPDEPFEREPVKAIR